MSIVTLVSGGLDSTLMAILAHEEGIAQFPLFVDYGQIAREREMAACRRVLRGYGVSNIEVIGISGYGAFMSSGLTDASKRVVEDAFTPGRNLMFLLLGAAYAYRVNANAVAIGLLKEDTSLFPDQTENFVRLAELTLSAALGRAIKVLTPLRAFSKADVVQLAHSKGVAGTYSCHVGGEEPCGRCIACREFATEGE